MGLLTTVAKTLTEEHNLKYALAKAIDQPDLYLPSGIPIGDLIDRLDREPATRSSRSRRDHHPVYRLGSTFHPVNTEDPYEKQDGLGSTINIAPRFTTYDFQCSLEDLRRYDCFWAFPLNTMFGRMIQNNPQLRFLEDLWNEVQLRVIVSPRATIQGAEWRENDEFSALWCCDDGVSYPHYGQVRVFITVEVRNIFALAPQPAATDERGENIV